MSWRPVRKALRVVLIVVGVLAGLVLLLRMRIMLSGEPEAAWVLLLLAVLVPTLLVRRTESRIVSDFAELPNSFEIPDNRVVPAEQAFSRAKMQYGVYWMILCAVFIFLYFPLGDEAEHRYSTEDSPIRSSQLKYFGRVYQSEGLKEFEYTSTLHEIAFYSLWMIPVLAGLVCANKVYSRLHKREIELWHRRPDRFANLFEQSP